MCSVARMGKTINQTYSSMFSIKMLITHKMSKIYFFCSKINSKQKTNFIKRTHILVVLTYLIMVFYSHTECVDKNS